MKKNATISCVLFTLLCVLQMVLMVYLCSAAPLTSVPLWVLVEVAAIFALGAAAVAIFSGNGLSIKGKKVLGLTSLLYLVSMGIFYNFQIDLMGTAFALTGSFDPAMTRTPQNILLIVKIILLVLAVYFAVAREKELHAELAFETAKDPAELETPEAMAELTQQLDETEG